MPIENVKYEEIENNKYRQKFSILLFFFVKKRTENRIVKKEKNETKKCPPLTVLLIFMSLQLEKKIILNNANDKYLKLELVFLIKINEIIR